MNRQQNKAFNLLLSVSNSFMSHAEGKDVAVFKTESKDFHSDLLDCGFTQDISKDKFNNYYGHSVYWNDCAQLLVSFAGNGLWTAATEQSPITASAFLQAV